MLFTLLVPPPYRERYINPYHYSPLETWKGDEKGNRDENGSKKEGLKKPPNKNPPQQQNAESPRRRCPQAHSSSPFPGQQRDPPGCRVSKESLISEQLPEGEIPQGSSGSGA